jgi:cold shock protein
VVAFTTPGRARLRDTLTCQDYRYMQTGTVKFFNTTRGFGFIAPDDGSKDVFVHVSAVERSGLGYLSEGQRVRFEVQRDPRGPKAVNLQAA